MTTITLPDDVAERLKQQAREKGQTLEQLLHDMAYRDSEYRAPTPEERDAALESMIGMFDADIPDFSSTIRETLDEYYRKKFGSGDGVNSD